MVDGAVDGGLLEAGRLDGGALGGLLEGGALDGGRLDGGALLVGGLLVGGLLVGGVVRVGSGVTTGGVCAGPSTGPYTRVAANSRVHRTGTSRTCTPLRGASTIRPLPAYMATWWMPVQLLLELKNSRSPGSSE